MATVMRRAGRGVTADRQAGTVRWVARASGTLLLGGLVVALAIALDGAAARAINGIGGILWIAAAAMLLAGLRHERRAALLASLTVALTVIVTVVIDPDDVVTAFFAFAVAGAVIAGVAVALAARLPVGWAALVPALWLPVHLLTAVVPAILGDGDRVRSDPPPTTAFVPFLMVAGALAGGVLVAAIRSRRGV